MKLKTMWNTAKGNRLIASIVLALLILAVLLISCSAPRKISNIPPDSPNFKYGFIEAYIGEDDVECLPLEDMQELYRWTREVCLLCHDFDPTKQFPKPTH